MKKGFRDSWNKCYSAFSEALLDCGEQFKKQGETMMTNAAEQWLGEYHETWLSQRESEDRHVVDPISGRTVLGKYRGSLSFPWFTGALHDSISVRIADGNTTIAVRYMPKGGASDNQFALPEDAGRYYPDIEGAIYGRLMAGRATRVPQTATVAQIFVGVPYAQKVDEDPKHKGYLNDMEVSFMSAMEDVFAEPRIRNLIIRPRK